MTNEELIARLRHEGMESRHTKRAGESWLYEKAADALASAMARIAELEAGEPLPIIAYKGPLDTDASMFREAVDRLERGYSLGGGNLTRAVIELIIREVARSQRPALAVTAGEEVLRDAKAEGWIEACKAFAWCRDNGPLEQALPYVIEHNPYREPVGGDD